MLVFAIVKRRLVRDATLYAAAVLLVGTAANLVPKRHVAWWGKGLEPPKAGIDYTLLDPMSADALRTSLPKVVILDTRAAAEFAAGHIPGARPIAFTDLDRTLDARLLAELRGADAVIISGAGTEADIEQLLAQQLVQRGVPRPFVLMGGLEGWLAAGLPLAEGDAK